jgi:pimeloyl-ACP methyl ester carboxylesterase
MSRPRSADAPPTEVSARDGLAYARFAPAGEARGGVLILHGAGSAKESHFDFARLCRAAGLEAVAADLRGHGASEGPMTARVLDDVVTLAGLLPDGPRFLRGSSMGGLLSLAAAERVGARAVVAICPAPGDGLARGVQAGRYDFEALLPGLADLFSVLDPEAAAAALGADLQLQHAEGDERVPIAHSEALHAAAPASTLIRVPGGHHRSVQHDPELQGAAVRFLLERT